MDALRTEPDFSALDFAQRFTATISADGRTINGRWEIANEPAQWEHDFDLVYRKITKRPEREPADEQRDGRHRAQIIETNSYMVLGTAAAQRHTVGVARLVRARRLPRVLLGVASRCAALD